MRGAMLALMLILAGCSGLDDSGPVTTSDGGSTVVSTVSEQMLPASGSGSDTSSQGASIRTEVRIIASSLDVPAGTQLPVTVKATVTDADGNPVETEDASWRIMLRKGSTVQHDAAGSGSTGTTNLNLESPGAYVLTGTVRASPDVEPVSVDADLVVQEATVEPLPTELVTPTVLPALALGKGAGEPNILIDDEGTIYVTPIAPFYRSDDGGATWVTGAATDGGGDGDTAADENGRIHWLGLFGDSGPIPHQYSDDGGRTWSPSVDLSDGDGSDREWIDTAPDGVVYATWRHNDGTVVSRTSRDHGESWEDMVSMGSDAVGGPVVSGPEKGTVYEALATFGGTLGGAQVVLARSSDYGASWDRVPVFTPAQSAQAGLIGFPFSIFPVVAVDEAGTLYVTFSVDQQAVPAPLPKPAARFGVYLTSSSDNGDTWTTPVLLSATEHASVMPFAVAGAPGRVAVVWYENTAGAPHDNLPDLWNVMLWESLTADEAQPEAVTVQLNTDPNHIGSVCTSGTGCLLTAGDRSLLDFFEVALTPQGQPRVTWMYTVAGTAVGIAAQGPTTYFGGADGTRLQ